MRWSLGALGWALVLLSACSASRRESLSCAGADDCADGESCREGQCVTESTQVHAVGRVQGAPGMVSIEGDAACKQGKRTECSAAPGNRVLLRAPIVEGFRFTGWSGDARCAGEEPMLAITLAKDVSCVANYVATHRAAGLVADSAEPVDATAEAPFSDCADGACVVDRGAQVTLTAPRRDGFRLTGWEGEGCPEQPEYEIVVVVEDADVTCTAGYVEALTARGEATGVAAVITASSADEGAQCGVDLCAVVAGGNVVLHAPEVDGGRFTGWTGDPACAGSERDVELASLSGNVLCVANYVPRATVRGVAEGVPSAPQIAASSSDAFAACAGETCVVDEGGTVSLQAPSVPGYRLQGWSGAGCERARGASVTVLDAKGELTCTATYVEGVAVIGTVVNADGEVTATSSMPGADCADGRCAIARGGSVRLTAPSLPDRTFVGWDGDPGCAATTPTIELVDVQASVTCNARFAARFTVTGKATPSAGGSVRATAAGGTARCTDSGCTVDEGASVVLTATANTRYRFTGWSGGGSCAGSAARLELSRVRANQTCTANFVARVTVVAVANPSGGGRVSVTALSSGAQCSGDRCTIDAGSDATLSAQASSGYRFTGWSGCGALGLGGLGQLVQVRQDVSCTANFERLYHVTASASPAAGGRATATLNGNDCGGSCEVSSDDTVRVEARPSDGYDFTGWSGCTGSGTTATVANVTRDVTCTAQFTAKTYPVTVKSAQPDLGSASGPSSVTHGGSVTLTARPSGNNILTGWDCAGSASGNTLVISNVKAAVSCTARFALRYKVNMVESPGSAGCGAVTVGQTTGTCDASNTCLLPPGGSVTYYFRASRSPCTFDTTCPHEGNAVIVGNVNQNGTCTWSTK